jgi:hypothetical protein
MRRCCAQRKKFHLTTLGDVFEQTLYQSTFIDHRLRMDLPWIESGPPRLRTRFLSLEIKLFIQQNMLIHYLTRCLIGKAADEFSRGLTSGSRFPIVLLIRCRPKLVIRNHHFIVSRHLRDKSYRLIKVPK